MQLSVIGARSGMPAPGQPSSGYVVQTEQCSLLFDCGPGVAGELAKVVAPKDLDAVFISHLHLDHCYDALPIGKSILAPYVPYPREGTRMELLGEPPRIPLYTPAGAGTPSAPFRRSSRWSARRRSTVLSSCASIRRWSG